MEWLPTPVILPGEFHGQRSLASYSLWGCKELDMTQQLTLSHSCYMYICILFIVVVWLLSPVWLFWDAMDCSLPVFCPWNFLLQEIFLTQGWNPSLLHWHADSLPGQAQMFGTSLVAQLVKNQSAVWETWVGSLGWEDPLEKGRAIALVFWPGELYSPCKKLDWATFTFTFIYLYLYLYRYIHVLVKEMATHSSVLAWRIPGTGEPDGLPPMGSHRVGHDWSDSAAAAAAAVCKIDNIL